MIKVYDVMTQLCFACVPCKSVCAAAVPACAATMCVLSDA